MVQSSNTYKETGEIIKGTPYLVEGIGQDCLPENVHFQYIDKIYNISDKESFATARRLTKKKEYFAVEVLVQSYTLLWKLLKNVTKMM